MTRRRAQHKEQPTQQFSWVVWGLVGGWVIGVAIGAARGSTFFSMIIGGIAGILIGTLADVIRGWFRKRRSSGAAPKSRHRPTSKRR